MQATNVIKTLISYSTNVLNGYLVLIVLLNQLQNFLSALISHFIVRFILTVAFVFLVRSLANI